MSECHRFWKQYSIHEAEDSAATSLNHWSTNTVRGWRTQTISERTVKCKLGCSQIQESTHRNCKKRRSNELDASSMWESKLPVSNPNSKSHNQRIQAKVVLRSGNAHDQFVSNICKMPGVPTLSTQWPAIGGVGYYRSFSAIKGARTENHEEVSPYALLCRNDRQGLNTLGPPKRKNPKESSEIFECFTPFESNSSQRAGSWMCLSPVGPAPKTSWRIKHLTRSKRSQHSYLILCYYNFISHNVLTNLQPENGEKLSGQLSRVFQLLTSNATAQAHRRVSSGRISDDLSSCTPKAPNNSPNTC